MMYAAYILIPYLIVLVIQLLIGQPNILGPMVVLMGLVLLGFSLSLKPAVELIKESRMHLYLLIPFVLSKAVLEFVVGSSAINLIWVLISDIVLYSLGGVLLANTYVYLKLPTANAYQQRFKEATALTAVVTVLSALSYQTHSYTAAFPTQPVPIVGIIGYIIAGAVFVFYGHAITIFSEQRLEILEKDEWLYRQATQPEKN